MQTMTLATVQRDDTGQLKQIAEQAGAVFDAGGLVVFPTETVYGIGASALRPEAVQALREVKQRPEDQPFTLHIPDAQSVERYVDVDHPVLRRFVRGIFPGPVTLIMQVTDDVIRRRLDALGLSYDQKHLIYHADDTVGLRCPDDALARAILGATDAPIVASSANRRGEHPPTNASAAAANMGDAAKLTVDGGPCRFSKASTIVRAARAGAGYRFDVLREGVYDQRIIDKLARFTILLVCTGNTCRSPMAAGIARKLLAERIGVNEDDLPTAGYRVLSAGVYANPGSRATDEAVEAVRQAGVDLSTHRSQSLTDDLVTEADVIYCMTRAHQQAVQSGWPDAGDKVLVLDETEDIGDPIGGPLSLYEDTARQIEDALKRRIEQLHA